MPDYTVGTQEWLYDLYSQFWDTSTGYSAQGQPDFGSPHFGQGTGSWAYGQEHGGSMDYYDPSAPSVNEFMQGFANVGQYNFGDFDEWENYNAPFGDWTEADIHYNPWQENREVGTFLNLDQWLAEWVGYMLTFDVQNLADARKIGTLERNKQVAELLDKGLSARKYINKGLVGSGNKSIDYLYDQAVSTGRLLDFKTSANLYDLEQGYLYDVYNQLGNIAGQGAFSSGGINQGAWQTTVGGGWGSEEATADNVNFCSSYCDDADLDNSEVTYGSCVAGCMNTGPGYSFNPDIDDVAWFFDV